MVTWWNDRNAHTVNEVQRKSETEKGKHAKVEKNEDANRKDPTCRN